MMIPFWEKLPQREKNDQMKIRGMNTRAISFIPLYLFLFLLHEFYLIEIRPSSIICGIVEGWVQRFDVVSQAQIMVTYKSEKGK